MICLVIVSFSQLDDNSVFLHIFLSSSLHLTSIGKNAIVYCYIERPAEKPYDPRSLFEQLEADRVRKEEEFQEKHALKNLTYRGVTEDEYEFLQNVERRNNQRELALLLEEQKEIKKFQVQATVAADEAKPVVAVIKQSDPAKKKKKSQLEFITGPTKHKADRDESEQIEPKSFKPDAPAPAPRPVVPAPTVMAPTAAPPPAPEKKLASLVGGYGSDEDDEVF